MSRSQAIATTNANAAADDLAATRRHDALVEHLERLASAALVVLHAPGASK